MELPAGRYGTAAGKKKPFVCERGKELLNEANASCVGSVTQQGGFLLPWLPPPFVQIGENLLRLWWIRRNMTPTTVGTERKEKKYPPLRAEWSKAMQIFFRRRKEEGNGVMT